MTIAFGDIVRTTVQYTLDSDEVHQNVLTHQAGIGVADTDANVMAAITTLMNTAYSNLNAQLATDVSLGEAMFAKLNQVSGKWEALGSVPMTQPVPSGGTTQSPNGIAAVIRFLADGVGNQGRKFIGGIQNLAIIDNALQAGAIASIVNWANIMVSSATVSGGTMDPGWWSVSDVVHRDYNGTYIINTIVGYQRRRKPGVGI